MSEEVAGAEGAEEAAEESIPVGDLLGADFDMGKAEETPAKPAEEKVEEQDPKGEAEEKPEEKPAKAPEDEEKVKDEEEDVKPRWDSMEGAEKSFRELEGMNKREKNELQARIKELETKAEKPAEKAPDRLEQMYETRDKVEELIEGLIQDEEDARRDGDTEAADALKFQRDKTDVYLRKGGRIIAGEEKSRKKAEEQQGKEKEAFDEKIGDLAREAGDEVTDKAIEIIKGDKIGDGKGKDSYPDMVFRLAKAETDLINLKKKAGTAPSLEGPGSKKASSNKNLTELQKVMMD